MNDEAKNILIPIVCFSSFRRLCPASKPDLHHPLWEDYLTDPYVFKSSDGYYYAIRMGLKDAFFNNEGELEYERQFPMLKSTDMQNWELVGGVLPTLKEPFLKRYWAPEIA